MEAAAAAGAAGGVVAVEFVPALLLALAVLQSYLSRLLIIAEGGS